MIALAIRPWRLACAVTALRAAFPRAKVHIRHYDPRAGFADFVVSQPITITDVREMLSLKTSWSPRRLRIAADVLQRLRARGRRHGADHGHGAEDGARRVSTDELQAQALLREAPEGSRDGRSSARALKALSVDLSRREVISWQLPSGWIAPPAKERSSGSFATGNHSGRSSTLLVSTGSTKVTAKS